MKKGRLKTWVKYAIVIAIIYTLGIACVFAICSRNEALDKKATTDVVAGVNK